MTTLEYMERQAMKHRQNFLRERDRGADEEVLHNISEKIRHYEAAVDALLAKAKAGESEVDLL